MKNALANVLGVKPMIKNIKIHWGLIEKHCKTDAERPAKIAKSFFYCWILNYLYVCIEKKGCPRKRLEVRQMMENIKIHWNLLKNIAYYYLILLLTCMLLLTTAYYFLPLLTTTYYYLRLVTTTYYDLLLLTTTYYYLLLLTATYYYLLLLTTTYLLALPTATYLLLILMNQSGTTKSKSQLVCSKCDLRIVCA